MRNLLAKLFYFRLCSFPMRRAEFFKVCYWSGDDHWSASIHVHHRWVGHDLWHVLFLPW
jgi:hypothetical protein